MHPPLCLPSVGRSGASCCYAILVACLLIAVPPCGAARPRISIEGHPEMDLPPNKDIKIPGRIEIFDDEGFYKVLKESDVVVMYVRENHCPDCDYYAEMFYNATESLAKLRGDGVRVGQIDVHEASDIFSDYHGVEEDLPALLVFKAHDTVKYHKKPIQFVVNGRLPFDLPPFVNRMRGPAFRDITTADEFHKMLYDATDYADGLALTLWCPPVEGDALNKKRRLFAEVMAKKVAAAERYNTVVGLISQKLFTEAAGDESLAPYLQHALRDTEVKLVSHETQYKPAKQNSLALPSSNQAMHDVRSTVKTALSWFHHEKPKRVGHKYDNIVSYFEDDIFVPQNCSLGRLNSTTKRYVRLFLEGKVSNTNTLLFARELEMVTLENTTMVGIERGLMGMCVGMRRLLVLPPAQREGWKFDPIELHESSQLHVLLTVKYIGPTNELPGRIEWETDPVKIAEHKRKAAEQDRLREEAIARGEDPDAQCKKKK